MISFSADSAHCQPRTDDKPHSPCSSTAQAVTEINNIGAEIQSIKITNSEKPKYKSKFELIEDRRVTGKMDITKNYDLAFLAHHQKQAYKAATTSAMLKLMAEDCLKDHSTKSHRQREQYLSIAECMIRPTNYSGITFGFTSDKLIDDAVKCAEHDHNIPNHLRRQPHNIRSSDVILNTAYQSESENDLSS